MNPIPLACGILSLCAAWATPASAMQTAAQEPTIKLQLVDTDIRDALRMVASKVTSTSS